MDLATKSLYLTHDEDSYEIVVDSVGRVLEVWRFRRNRPSIPVFCHPDDLDEILKDRIGDTVARNYGDSSFPTNGS